MGHWVHQGWGGPGILTIEGGSDKRVKVLLQSLSDLFHLQAVHTDKAQLVKRLRVS